MSSWNVYELSGLRRTGNKDALISAERPSYKLLEHVRDRLKSSLRKFYGRSEDLTKHSEISLSQMRYFIMFTYTNERLHNL